MPVSIADIQDAAAVTALLNSAYRGETSKKGWTTEAHLIAGNTRTTIEQLRSVMEQPQSVLLKYTDAEGTITGCVNLQQHGDKLYLGMLSVSPLLQGKGIGKTLLKAADDYAGKKNCKAIYMLVVSVRNELIDWYTRHGYVLTGETKPFIEDGITGKHLQPLQFAVLEKRIGAAD